MVQYDYMTMPFDELADLVFTNDGHVKACGRDACKALITRLEEMHGLPAKKFGNVETGILNVEQAFGYSKALKY